jgi:hypothetical protein
MHIIIVLQWYSGRPQNRISKYGPGEQQLWGLTPQLVSCSDTGEGHELPHVCLNDEWNYCGKARELNKANSKNRTMFRVVYPLRRWWEERRLESEHKETVSLRSEGRETETDKPLTPCFKMHVLTQYRLGHTIVCNMLTCATSQRISEHRNTLRCSSKSTRLILVLVSSHRANAPRQMEYQKRK